MTDFIRRIRGSAEKIDALILAAKMDGVWDAVANHARIYTEINGHRTVVMQQRRGRYVAQEWERVVTLASKMGLKRL